DADALRRAGDGGDQDFGCGTDDGVVAVVFGKPKSVVAQSLTVLGERDRGTDRLPMRATDHGDRLIQNRQAHLRVILAWDRGHPTADRVRAPPGRVRGPLRLGGRPVRAATAWASGCRDFPSRG